MGNNTPESKLDETVKDTLNNYQADYDAGDWSRMESMLNATPKSSGFQWSYMVKIAVVLGVILGGYLLFNVTRSPEVKDEIIKNPETTPSENIVKETPKTPVAVPPVVSPKIDPVVISNEVAKETNNPDKVGPTSPVIEKIKSEEKLVIKKEEKPKDKKTKKEKENPEENVIKHTLIMGNEPVFGDMLDSSKGVVSETKEKESTKKAAKEKKLPPGWDSFMTPNVNPDSIKKHREKRDSLNNQH
jgi:hypothetical protein